MKTSTGARFDKFFHNITVVGEGKIGTVTLELLYLCDFGAVNRYVVVVGDVLDVREHGEFVLPLTAYRVSLGWKEAFGGGGKYIYTATLRTDIKVFVRLLPMYLGNAGSL